LPRAILDAGDVVVLGDEVALKFVQAGDVFRPGPHDRRGLAPARRELIAPVLRGERKPILLPALLFLLIVTIGGAFALWWARRR
jgi:hypothetical protein